MPRRKASRLNLSVLDTVTPSTEGVELPILDPRTGEPFGDVVFIVAGPDSDQFIRSSQKYIKRFVKQGKEEDKELDLVQEREDVIEMLSELILGWRNLYWDDEGGEETDSQLEYSKENAVMVLRKVPTIRDQVQEFVQNRRNFIKKQPKVSAKR